MIESINITLLLQAVQFAIAYFFLYKFLFAPAYKILHEQELFEKELYKNLKQEHQIKDSMQQMYYQRQIALKESLMNMVPSDAVQSGFQKLDTSSTLYDVDKIKISQVQIDMTEKFLVDSLSQVIK